MITSDSIKWPITNLFVPLFLRLQQLKCFTIDWEGEYKLPTSEVDLEAIKKESTNFPSDKVLKILGLLKDDLNRTYEVLEEIKVHTLIHRNSHPTKFEEQLENLEGALAEVTAYKTEVFTLYEMHKAIIATNSELDASLQIQNDRKTSEYNPKPIETKKTSF